MREVLRLEYDASTRALLVTSAATIAGKNDDGSPVIVRLLGAVDPVARFDLAALPEPHRSAMTAFLEALPDMVESKVADLSSPEKIRAAAADIAREEQRIAQERLAAQVDRDRKRAEAGAALVKAKEAEAALLGTTAQVAAQQAELARLDLERTQRAAAVATAREEARAVAAAIEMQRAELAAVKAAKEAATAEEP